MRKVRQRSRPGAERSGGVAGAWRAIFGLALGFPLVVVTVRAEEAAVEQHAEIPKAPSPAVKRKQSHDDKSVVMTEDPRGVVDLVVCSQNLKLFGSYATIKLRDSKYTPLKHEAKVEALVNRFVQAKCDVIAVQEVIGSTTRESEAALSELAAVLRARQNRFYDVRVAPPSDGKMGPGFLVAKDRAQILHSFSYSRVELPRLSKKQKPRIFSRTPLEIQLAVRSRDGDTTKNVSIVNFHLKSKRGGEGDPTGLEWETYRMEMSEALRQIVESRHKGAFATGESLLILLGDRNSDASGATARILEGSVTLSSFTEGGQCRLSKRGIPLCKVGAELPRRLFSVLTDNPGVHTLPGTFTYKGEHSWLDDILMPAESLRFAWRSPYTEGEFDSGVLYTPAEASDHALVYVKLNW